MRKLRRTDNVSPPPVTNPGRKVLRLAQNVGRCVATAGLAAAGVVPLVAEAANLNSTPDRPSSHVLPLEPLSDAFSTTSTGALRQRLSCPPDAFPTGVGTLGGVEYGERTLRRGLGLPNAAYAVQFCSVLGEVPPAQSSTGDATLTGLRSRLGSHPSLPLSTAQVAFDYLVERGLLRAPNGDPTPLLREYLALADAPLDPTIDRGALLSELVYDVAAPFLGQRGGTCVGNAMAQFLAVHHPSEYVRLTRELASPTGAAVTVTGVPLRRLPSGPVALDDSLQTRLLIPALMDLANGFLGYSSEGGFMEDQHRLGVIDLKITGLPPQMAEHALEALTGDSFNVRSGMWLSRMNERDELRAAIERADRGEATLVYWKPPNPPGTPLYKEVYERLDFTSHGGLLLGRGAANTVRVLDPYGFIRELPEDGLAQWLDAVVYRGA